MGILAKSCSITQMVVVNSESINTDLIGELLAKKAFMPIDSTSDPLSIGWVSLDDSSDTDFTSGVIRDRWATFSMRVDRRRIPGAVLRQHIKAAEETWLQDHPGINRVPKQVRAELREAVLGNLLAKTLPVPSVCDAVWDLPNGIITLSTHSQPTIELFQTLFKATFEGARLVLYHPYARAMELATPEQAQKLGELNRAGSDHVFDLMRENAWLGSDFLLWLTHSTANGLCCSSAKEISTTCYVSDKIILIGSSDGAKQKITAAGPLNHFAEVRAALQEGKIITKAAIQIESGEDVYSMVLDGETFKFGSLWTPPVRLEKDDLTDESSERQAVFFEKVHLMETAMDAFNGIFATFLNYRLSNVWFATASEIHKWINGE